MIQLGDRVVDRITGLTGVAIARTDWLFGCRRIGVQPETVHEGKLIEAQWFDEGQLVTVDERVIVGVEMVPRVSTTSLSSSGGPSRPEAPRRDPVR